MTAHSESTTPATPTDITDESEFDTLRTTSDVMFVDFYADWCGPCQMMEDTVDELAAETDAAVAKVDVDQFQQLAQRFQVQGVPTFLLFVDGEVAERVVGVQPGPKLKALIDSQVA